MKKTLIIIRREYLSRVKKRSFVVMTILGPLLLAAMMIVPYYIAKIDSEQKTINVVDETGLFYNLKDNATIKFNYIYSDISSAKKNFNASGAAGLLYIKRTSHILPENAELFYTSKQPGNTVVTYIQSQMEYELKKHKLEAEGIDIAIINKVKADVNIRMESISTGKVSNSVINTFLGIFLGFIIYFAIFMYGSQVMRGVIEEKTSRIVEIIVSSVKPFQLLIGKITGIALVGLTQFLLWVILTLCIVTVFQATVGLSKTSISTGTEFVKHDNTLIPEKADIKPLEQGENKIISSVFKDLANYDFAAIIALFFFYFLFGYLLYAALFAAVGSAVDSEADTQQFMLPITIPLILAFIMAQTIIENPQGSISFWFSIIPLTSPIVMMMKLPFGVPVYELILSMATLVLGFFGVVWLAAKIYRTGILMYGKKVNYRELWKWLKY